jgi:sugar lactone lactonase YvrE
MKAQKATNPETTMARSRFVILAAALLMSLSPVAASAHDDDDDLPDRIDLPDGWRPEGITTDGDKLFVGSLANGAILRANPRTGHIKVIAEGAPGSMTVGVDYDRHRDLLWAAGGGTKEVRAYDADSGDLLATYSFPSANARFINDLVVKRRAVFATDSLARELMVVRLGRGDRLPGQEAANTLPLTGDFVLGPGNNLNGIVAAGRRRLIAIQGGEVGLLFRINQRTGVTRTIDLDGDRLINGDGLERDGDILYVVQNRLNQVAVVELEDRFREGEVEDELTDDDFDVPTTVALLDDSLYLPNARFGTAGPEPAEYWVTRIDAFDD